METITLRNIPESLALRIEEKARRSGASLGQTVIEMLTERSGEAPRPPRHGLDRLMGTWSSEEADAFDAELVRLRAVDPEPDR